MKKHKAVLAVGCLAFSSSMFNKIDEKSQVFERIVIMGKLQLPQLFNIAFNFLKNKNNFTVCQNSDVNDCSPQVVCELNNTDAYEGTMARFKCKFKGQPTPAVTW